MNLSENILIIDLPNNDKLTNQLETATVFEYLLNFIEICFKTEMKNICDAIPRLNKYYDVIGSEYISSIMLEGIVKNLIAYFKEVDEDFEYLNQKAQSICNNMRKYSTDIGDKQGVYFDISHYLKEYMERKK